MTIALGGRENLKKFSIPKTVKMYDSDFRCPLLPAGWGVRNVSVLIAKNGYGFLKFLDLPSEDIYNGPSFRSQMS